MSFAKSVGHVLVEEGGYVDNRLDPGGRTNRGVTQRYLDASRAKHPEMGLPADVADVTDAIATKLYSVNEWEEIQGDLLKDPVSYCMLDFAVNSGSEEAIRCLQRGLSIPVDGVMGPQTIKAANDCVTFTVMQLSTQRVMFLMKLREFPTFGHDWISRAVSTAIGAFQ